MLLSSSHSGSKLGVVQSGKHGTASPRGAWYLLLVVPYLALLYPPLYSYREPAFLGFPFFYWYQFLWVFLSALLTGIVYLALRRR